jgi:aldehyde dehydrogenase (NAD+)
MISETFDQKYFAVVTGDAETSQALLKHPFDYIFFTGSTPVGKIIMKAAAEHLTPVTLELGGKSPVIVDETADLEIAAKRITWAKFVNAGQTCVAPDYMYVHENVREELLGLMKTHITQMYGEEPSESEDYPRIINDGHFDRLSKLITDKKVLIGGQTKADDRYISPTILHQVNWDDPVMQDEIFGPILPVMEYQNLEEVFRILERKAKPLAFYIFTSDNRTEKEALKRLSFGGGAVNDAIIHLGNHNLPFGGVGKSGMGAYHGKHSFDTFSHHKSIIKSRTLFDIPLRYPPYREKPDWLRRFF